MALDDTGEASNTDLARTVYMTEPCLDPPDPETDDPATGQLVKQQCRCIEGWAFDGDDLDRAVEVRMRLSFEGQNNTSEWFYTTANRDEPTVGVEGNHGFKFDIEDDKYDEWKSTELATQATVQVKDMESGEWLVIAEGQTLVPTPCLEEEPPQEPVYCEWNEALLADDPRCLECPYEPGLWIDDPACDEPFALIVRSKKAQNITQLIEDANGTTASPGDVIEYSLIAQNLGTISETISLEESMVDVLEYADIIDIGYGEFNVEQGLVTWESVELQPDETITRTIMVKVKDEIPATPTSVGDPESFNLVMTNVFGDDSVEIKVKAPISKEVEMVVRELPNTGTGTNTMVMAATAAITVYMYLRNRQLGKELRLVRAEYNLGSA